MTSRKQGKPVSTLSKDKRSRGRSNGRRSRRSPAVNVGAIADRLQAVEARTTALSHAVRFAVVRLLQNAPDPIQEIERYRRRSLKSVGYIDDLQEAMWVDELMQFCNGVVAQLPKAKSSPR